MKTTWMAVVLLALASTRADAQSLTGTWRFASDTSVMSEVTLVLTEIPNKQMVGSQVVGSWTATRAGCQPVTDECRWRGTVFGSARREFLQMHLVPRVPDDVSGAIASGEYKAGALNNVLVSFGAGTIAPVTRGGVAVGITATFTKAP